MICPACGKNLTTRSAGTIPVDVCEGGCGGVWFDNFELKKVDDAGAAALKVVSRDLHVAVDLNAKRECPRCSGQIMLRRYFSRLRRTQIDECPNCAGLWLDAGEFEAIQQELGEQPDPGPAGKTMRQTVGWLRAQSGR